MPRPVKPEPESAPKPDDEAEADGDNEDDGEEAGDGDPILASLAAARPVLPALETDRNYSIGF